MITCRLAAHSGSVARHLAIVADLFLEVGAGTVAVALFLTIGAGGILGPDCVDLVAPSWHLIQIVLSGFWKNNGNGLIVLKWSQENMVIKMVLDIVARDHCGQGDLEDPGK